jgi:hypothetical protein
MDVVSLLLTLLIGGQGSPDWHTREKCTAALKDLLPHSLPHLTAAGKCKTAEVAIRSKVLAGDWHTAKLDEWIESHRPFPWIDMLPQDQLTREFLISTWVEYAQSLKPGLITTTSYDKDKSADILMKGWPYYRLACELWVRDHLEGHPTDAGTFHYWDQLLSAMRKQEPIWLHQWKTGMAGTP